MKIKLGLKPVRVLTTMVIMEIDRLEIVIDRPGSKELHHYVKSLRY